MCVTAKLSYRTRRKAIVALDRVRSDQRRVRSGKGHECAFYRCPQCGEWHLTSHPRATA